LIEIEAPSGTADPIVLEPRVTKAVLDSGDKHAQFASQDPYKELWDRLVAETPAIQIPAKLTKPHRAVATLLAEEEREREQSRRWPHSSMHFRPRYETPLARRPAHPEHSAA
jgi:hypothetical protein